MLPAQHNISISVKAFLESDLYQPENLLTASNIPARKHLPDALLLRSMI
jgi:hypothetical protein